MSFPNIPNITPITSLGVAGTIPLLLGSIAFEELALAHLMNAEAEKLQFALGTLIPTSTTLTPTTVSLDNLLAIDSSVQRTFRDVINKEMLLGFKFENALDLLGILESLSAISPRVFEFPFTGAPQTFIVPSFATRIRIEVFGAQGGRDDVHLGGLGGFAVGETNVVPGETFFIFVGGSGADFAAGFGGGSNSGGGAEGGNAGPIGDSGGGGGSSDVRRGGTTLADRIIVAGGGGGAGRFTDGQAGGIGDNVIASARGADNPDDGGGGGGGFQGGNFNTNCPLADCGAFGGSSFTGTLENASTTPGIQAGDGFVTITVFFT